MVCHFSPSAAEDSHGEPDEPPDHRVTTFPGPPRATSIYKKSAPHTSRRTSLLTQQLSTSHPEDHHPESSAVSPPSSQPLVRGLSASSGRSVPSTYELTSDNDFSSAGIRTASPSPPPQATHPVSGFLTTKKSTIAAEPLIIDHESHPAPDPEKLLEADLGRRRCITFACGGGSGQRSPVKADPIPADASGSKDDEHKPEPQVRRKCMLTFACPSRERPEENDIFATLSRQSTREHVPQASKPVIESESLTAPIDAPVPRVHRDSDATVRNVSPQSFKKPMFVKRRTYSVDLHLDEPESPGAFHEFGPNNADEAWTTEVDLTKPAITMSDCLYKENLIRKLGDEADQEALEEEEVYGEQAAVKADDEQIDPDDEASVADEGDNDGENDDDDDDLDEEDEDSEDDLVGSRAVSETGFDSDDEGGFHAHGDNGDDDEDDGSDYEWWNPGAGPKDKSANESAVRTHRLRSLSPSSLASVSDDEENDGSREKTTGSFLQGRSTSASLPVVPNTAALPDSTDFVCGTLDEDRPLEQVYMSQLAKRRAKKMHHDAIKALRQTEDPARDSQRDGMSSPHLGYITSTHGSMSSRAARSGASRHVSREPSPYPNRNLSKCSGPLAGRTKHNRSPAPNRLRFRETSCRRPRSPAPNRSLFTPRSQSPADEGRRLSDPGTPAQPMFIHGTQTPTKRSMSHKTFSLPKGSSAIAIDYHRRLRFADDDNMALLREAKKRSEA